MFKSLSKFVVSLKAGYLACDYCDLWSPPKFGGAMCERNWEMWLSKSSHDAICRPDDLRFERNANFNIIKQQ